MSRVLRSGRAACAMLAIVSSTLAFSATAGSRSARSLVTQKIDNNARITLTHNVRPELNAKTDLGPVEDTMSIARMFLVLKRAPEQQAALANLIERQHQATAPEFHKWITPDAFGEKFGASQADIAKVTDWLTSQGFRVNYVTHGNSMIDFSGTARMVRESFHTQLHYLEINGEKRVANAQDPQIPAALAPIVGGIVNLENIPPHANHTAPHSVAYDKDTHTWHDAPGANQAPQAQPQFLDPYGNYAVAPQDFYTIYNENPLLAAGHTGANATIAVIEETSIVYGTVNGTTHQATGGDVATFRSVFGVPGTLNMYVYSGYGSTTCTAPPVVNGEEVEATLDAEWATAVAPAAKLIFMTCANNNELTGGIFASMTALIDNNLSDAMSLSYGSSEIGFPTSEYTFFDNLAEQAATQGQSIFISSGDSGSDVADQDTASTATSGINVSAFSDGPYITSTGGTDFQDFTDSQEGGPAQSTYWSSTNSSSLGDALSYVPETAWNGSCASSEVATFESTTPVAFCNSSTASADGLVAGDVVGGSGGFSTHYSAPSYQTGITGFTGSMRAQPDIAMFASNGFWGHYLVFCDTTDGDPCTSQQNIAGAGGTSFVAPQMAGLGGLLMDYTGSRQGVLNYGLYALAKAQFTNAATKTACYANGQTSNTGVTTGLPASSCIFHDVTTSNNDVPCASGSLDCYTGGSTYGILSTTGSGSLTTAYNSGVGYDEVSGIGSINIYNLLTKWNTAFTSTTALTASPTSISTAQSTTLSATVTGGTPAGYSGSGGPAPTLAGSVNFLSGTTKVGSCTLSSGKCSAMVSGATLGAGSHSVTATFVGSNAYPTSTSKAVTVTVTSTMSATTTAVTATPNSATQGTSIALKATVTSSGGTPTGTVSFTDGSTSLGTCTLSSGTCTASTTALPVGSDTVTASYGGATDFTTSFGTVKVTITAATATTTTRLTATPNPAVVGQTVSLKATVTASSGTATGKVNFTVGTVAFGSCTLSAGTCTFSASSNGQAPGTYPVVATYAGATGFSGSKSSAVPVELVQAATTTTVTASANPVTPPANETLTATVKRVAPGAGAPTGSVTFSVGSTVLGKANLNGSGVAKFTASTKGQAAGNYPVTARYTGDASDSASGNSVDITVN